MGIDSVDAAQAKLYLTGYGKASQELTEVLVDLAEWLANTSPPWGAYRGLMTRRLLGLDKEPGTRPVGIGSIWLRYTAKVLLKETAAEAKSACGAMQLCTGLEAGVEGGLHAIHRKLTDMGGLQFCDGEIDIDEERQVVMERPPVADAMPQEEAEEEGAAAALTQPQEGQSVADERVTEGVRALAAEAMRTIGGRQEDQPQPEGDGGALTQPQEGLTATYEMVLEGMCALAAEAMRKRCGPSARLGRPQRGWTRVRPRGRRRRRSRRR